MNTDDIALDKQRSERRYVEFDTVIDFVRDCINRDYLLLFYNSQPWRNLRREVLEADNNECQICKAAGKYKKATHVHHVNHVTKRPELAMSKLYTDRYGKLQRNLISVCKGCHETVCHPEKQAWREKPEPLTEERW